jgi:hypothetical protein
MITYRLCLAMSCVIIQVILLFSSSISIFSPIGAYTSPYAEMNLSTIDLDYYESKQANCSTLTAYLLYQNSSKIPQLLSQLPNPNNETQELTWYVQERPSCSNVILYTLEELKRNDIDIIDFRDSRLGELSPKGAPSQQCLACNICIDAYLLILTDDELSKSTLEHLGFKQVESMEKYIEKIRYGK